MTATPAGKPAPQVWRAKVPLVLASGSATRSALLAAAGLVAAAVPADVDERAIEARFVAEGHAPEALAAALAQAKALSVSRTRPDAYCLGADQTLTVEGKLLHKPGDLDEAASTLASLSGRTHELTSAFCVALGGRAVGRGEDRALLTMRPLDAGQIAAYLALAGAGVLSSVGAYQLEGMGMHLFERVEGDHSTVLGLPMLKLLAWLRGQDLIALR